MDLLQEFVSTRLKEAQKKSNIASTQHQHFFSKYPKKKIATLTLPQYVIAPKLVQEKNPSFCYSLRYHCDSICSMKPVRDECFGIYIHADSTGMNFERHMNRTLDNMFCGNYDKAFEFIKSEIINLLDAMERDDYDAIEENKLNSAFKSKLLSVYFPKKYFPVVTQQALEGYLVRLNLSYDKKDGLMRNNQKLLAWKNENPTTKDWTNATFMTFCDWLWKVKEMTIDGKHIPRKPQNNKM